MISSQDWNLLRTTFQEQWSQGNYLPFFYLSFICLTAIIFIVFGLSLVIAYRKEKEKLRRQSVQEGGMNDPHITRMMTPEELNFLNSIYSESIKNLRIMWIVFFTIDIIFVMPLYLGRSVAESLSILFIINFFFILLSVYLLKIKYYLYLDKRSPLMQLRGPMHGISNIRRVNNLYSSGQIFVRGSQFVLYFFNEENKNPPGLRNITQTLRLFKEGDNMEIEYTAYTKTVLSVLTPM